MNVAMQVLSRLTLLSAILATLLCALSAQEGVAQVKDCDYLRSQGVLYDGAGSFREGYDTLRLFVERCAADIHHPSYRWLSIFGKLTSEYTGLATTRGISQDFQQWLRKVLFVNRDTDYYCADVSALLATFRDSAAGQTSELIGEEMSVINYILEGHRCTYIEGTLRNLYQSCSEDRHQAWVLETYRNGVDTTLNPYDSSYQSIDDYGLSWLRGPEAAVGASPSRTSSAALLGVSVVNNPFKEALEILVELSRQSLVSVELYDLLGNKLPMKDATYRLQSEGKHTMTIPSESLPSGSYYLRVTTDHGDTKTVKVIKQ